MTLNRAFTLLNFLWLVCAASFPFLFYGSGGRRTRILILCQIVLIQLWILGMLICQRPPQELLAGLTLLLTEGLLMMRDRP